MRIAALVLACMVQTASAKSSSVDIELPQTFMGGVKQAATLLVTLRNDGPQLVEFGYSDLQPYLKVSMTTSAGVAVPCRTPKAREKRGQAYQWMIDPKKRASVHVDLLARCDLRKAGTYRVSVVLAIPGTSQRFWTGKTAAGTSTLKLGGGSGNGPVADGTIPRGCIAYDAVPPDKAGCTWVCGTKPVCSGVPSSEPRPTREPAYVCNGCMRHADCTAKPNGKCVLLPGDTCESAAYACVYPGDACFAPAHCDKTCFVSDGQARFAEPSGPPPAHESSAVGASDHVQHLEALDGDARAIVEAKTVKLCLARKIRDVSFAPIVIREIAFAFTRSGLCIDLAERYDAHLGRPQHDARVPESIRYDANTALVRERSPVALGGVDPAHRHALLATSDEMSQLRCHLGSVAERPHVEHARWRRPTSEHELDVEIPGRVVGERIA